MDRTLTEELVLLSLDPDKGTLAVDGIRLRAAVAGASVVRLTLDGVLVLDEPERRGGRFRRVGTVPDDPTLAAAAELADGHGPKDAVSRIGGIGAWRDRAGTLRDEALESLTASGVLRREDHKVLGLFPQKRWHLERPEVDAGIRERVADALAGADDGRVPDARTAALVSLLAAVDRVHDVAPAYPRQEAKRRAEAVAGSGWASPAVRAAVQEVHAVLVTTMAAATVATTVTTT